MQIKISSLPIEIQQQIPLSIRAFKDEYELTELPPTIQNLILSNKTKDQQIKYETLYDVSPIPSVHGDTITFDNIFDLVVEYISNYLMTAKGQFPFDVSHGSRLREYVNIKDTVTRKNMITQEINSIVNAVSIDTKIPIKVESISIQNQSNGEQVVCNVMVNLLIYETKKSMTVSVSVNN